ncbi:replication protein RepA [Isoptericola sp. NPDC056605]|uniref:replication protein RepA n=1 Tax=Isoptericola sp. NPDC056605 TaxID=3345876 RepID=UPI00369C5502
MSTTTAPAAGTSDGVDDGLPGGLVALAKAHAQATSHEPLTTPVPVPLSGEGGTPIRLSRRESELVEAAYEIETSDAAAAGEIGYAARIWTQLALPYSDPGAVPRWERRNGAITLIMRPATILGPDGQSEDGYPFGVLPRYLLSWMATEAVRTQNPCLDLGGSFNEFMGRLGLGHNGRDAGRLKNQIYRLVGATMQIQEVHREGDGHRVGGQNFSVAESFDLWLPGRGDISDDQGALWSNTVTLSPQFYRSIVQTPVPVDLRALRALKGAPMRLDIYTWLTHRMSYLSRSTLVPWSALEVQFGGQFARRRKFKETFVKNLAAVSALYPAANVHVEDAGLRLFPSAPHVSTRAARALAGGDPTATGSRPKR